MRDRLALLWRKKYVRLILGGLGGGLLGAGYYLLVGCRTGACPITAHPGVTTLWGAALGMLALH